MAFATTNVRRSAFGDLKVTAGDWTGVNGDASGTVTVEGGRVYAVEITTQDVAQGPVQQIPATVATGTATNTMTVTIHNRQTTNAGRFLIIHG